MDISPLQIKLSRQDPSSHDCGRCCTLMLLRFLGDKVSREEIWHKLHVYKKHSGLYGSYLADIGSFILNQGHQVTINHYDWHWWDKPTMAATQKSQSQMIKALRTLRKDKKDWSHKKIIDKEIRFVKKGGTYKAKLPKLSHIDAILKQGLPALLAVRSEELYHDPEETYNHFILAIGKKNNTYLIRDPYLAIEEVAEDELYYTWTRQGGWLLAVKPRFKPKPQLPLFA